MRCFKALLYKAYLDKGIGLTHYVKYVILIFGVTTQDLKNTLYFAFGYALFCFLLGWVWYRFEFIHSEIEVNNRFNPFVLEMREDIKKRKV